MERIATGRNAGPVLRVLLEQGVGEYLGKFKCFETKQNNESLRFFFVKGFPSNVDPKEIEEHWRQCFESKPHALTILMKLFRNSNEVKTMKNKNKQISFLSKFFLVKNL